MRVSEQVTSEDRKWEKRMGKGVVSGMEGSKASRESQLARGSGTEWAWESSKPFLASLSSQPFSLSPSLYIPHLFIEVSEFLIKSYLTFLGISSVRISLTRQQIQKPQ